MTKKLDYDDILNGVGEKYLKTTLVSQHYSAFGGLSYSEPLSDSEAFVRNSFALTQEDMHLHQGDHNAHVVDYLQKKNDDLLAKLMRTENSRLFSESYNFTGYGDDKK